MALRRRSADKARIETVTDELAAPAYDTLDPEELDQLVEDLEPLAADSLRMTPAAFGTNYSP